MYEGQHLQKIRCIERAVSELQQLEQSVIPLNVITYITATSRTVTLHIIV